MFLWSELINTANYLINRGPTKANNSETPEERYSQEKPSVKHLRIIGSITYVHIPKEERTKFEFKTRKCILVGFDEQSRVYRVFDLQTQKIILSKDVVINETKVGYEHIRPKVSIQLELEDLDFFPIFDLDVPEEGEFWQRG